MPWWAKVERVAIAVDSCPPPRPAVETKIPANLPKSLPCCQSWPVASQKVYGKETNFKRLFHILSIFEIKKTHLPLSREVTETSGDTEEDGVELREVIGFKDGIAGLGRRIHLGQDFLRESLGDPDKQKLIRERGLVRQKGNDAYW